MELAASEEVRKARNVTENRLHNKASKQDIETSFRRLQSYDERYRLEIREGEIPFENYIKIDNTDVPPDAVALEIKERFRL